MDTTFLLYFSLYLSTPLPTLYSLSVFLIFRSPFECHLLSLYAHSTLFIHILCTSLSLNFLIPFSHRTFSFLFFFQFITLFSLHFLTLLSYFAFVVHFFTTLSRSSFSFHFLSSVYLSTFTRHSHSDVFLHFLNTISLVSSSTFSPSFFNVDIQKVYITAKYPKIIILDNRRQN